MEENIRSQEEISLGEIFKILFKRLKLLILALVVGALIGGSIGVIRTYNVRYYGSSVEFYVNPKKDEESVTNESQYGVYGAYGWHVMDNITRLLASESFAERLLLDDDGLPLEQVLTGVSNREEIESKMEESRGPLDKAKAATKAVEEAKAETAAKLEAYNEASAEYNRQLNGSNANDSDVKKARDAMDKAKSDWEAAVATEDSTKEIEKEDWEDAYAAVEEARVVWRETAQYAQYVSKITASVSYSYYDKSSNEDVSELAKSFIYVTISVLEDDGKFAQFLFDRVNEVLPVYVEENMAVPSGYVGTNCQRITRLDKVVRTNTGYAFKTAAKYALLAGAAAFVVACVAVIVIDRSNKRLRDYELTFERFGIPVLGVIPNIDPEDIKVIDETTTEMQGNDVV